MSQFTRKDVIAALAQKTGFEMVTEKETEKQYRFTGRCHPSRWSFLLPVVYQLHRDSTAPSAWKNDISKQYILFQDRVLYCWRFIFEHESIASQYEGIVRAIRSAPLPARVEVTEVLLPGYKAGDIRGGVNAKGKGAASAGTSPMILNRR